MTAKALSIEPVLISAERCAAMGDVSNSFWYAEVAAGLAPKPVVSGFRFTRWSYQDVKVYWQTKTGIDPRMDEIVRKGGDAAKSARAAKRAGAKSS
jgi:predicted DNA-binding transcriptional regulator AlpA